VTTSRTGATGTAPTAARPPARAAVEPELTLEVLVFSQDPAERSAWISGQRYVEGQRVQGRFLVERIQEDGVVLTGDGKRLVLRQE
jgi:hypothetical protein